MENDEHDRNGGLTRVRDWDAASPPLAVIGQRMNIGGEDQGQAVWTVGTLVSMSISKPANSKIRAVRCWVRGEWARMRFRGPDLSTITLLRMWSREVAVGRLTSGLPGRTRFSPRSARALRTRRSNRVKMSLAMTSTYSNASRWWCQLLPDLPDKPRQPLFVPPQSGLRRLPMVPSPLAEKELTRLRVSWVDGLLGVVL